MLNYILLLAQAQTSETGQTSPQWMTFVMMGLVFVIFYFFMIRPQQKKQKELQKQREALKKGDKVVTAGGIYGIIKEVNETTFMLEISKEVIIKVDKASVFVATEDAHQAQSNEKK
jgi:preprotein translocase subunit YajC